jgi:hypothetical protein
MLNGKGGVTESDINRLVGVCRFPASEADALLELFLATQERGLLQLRNPQTPNRLRTLVEHEMLASEIIRWSMNLIPGQLQTPDYHRALIEASPNVPSEEVDDRVAARASHQHNLLALRRDMTFYVHEDALHLKAGPELMSDQLHHLVDLSVRPYITIRVVPSSIGAYPGQGGPFTFLKFDRFEPLVYTDAETYGLFLDDEDTIKVHLNVLEALDRVTLDETRSRELITGIASGHATS